MVAAEDANRRTDLVRAAAKLFREKGFEATTVRDIAGAVGMQSGSPFYHFGSKHEILQAVMEQGLNDALARAEAAIDASMTAPDRLRALVHVHFSVLHDEGSEFVAVMLYEWRSLPPELRLKLEPLKDRYDALWQDTFAELHRLGLLDLDPKLARLMALGAINFTATWYRPAWQDRGAIDIGTLAEQTARLFLGEARADSDGDAAALRSARHEVYALRHGLAHLRQVLSEEGPRPNG